MFQFEKVWLRRARLVAREYAHLDPYRQGLFAPTTANIMTRVIPAVFLQQKANGWTMLSLDVSDAFLTVAQLEPTITKINGSWFKLHKMVPGQRAGSSRWFEAFTEHIKQGAQAELLLEQPAPALFRLPNRSGGGMVHVDDLMAAGVTKSLEELEKCVSQNTK